MPALGLVAHLPVEPGARLRVLASLAAMPGLTFGEVMGDRLPLVLESDGRAQDRQRWDALQATPGLVHLELACADFSDADFSDADHSDTEPS